MAPRPTTDLGDTTHNRRKASALHTSNVIAETFRQISVK